MILSLPAETQISALVWMLIGLVIYMSYSRKHSKLGTAYDALPTATDFEKE
jgi:APA family basic amino acid/polyamine antiporter